MKEAPYECPLCGHEGKITYFTDSDLPDSNIGAVAVGRFVTDEVAR